MGRSIRLELRLTLAQFGQALGYCGPNVSITVSHMEGDRKPVPVYIERLALMFAKHGVPTKWTQD
jgi:hypothetical protein